MQAPPPRGVLDLSVGRGRSYIEGRYSCSFMKRGVLDLSVGRVTVQHSAGLVCRTWTLVYRGAIFIFIHEEIELPACPQVRRSYIERQLWRGSSISRSISSFIHFPCTPAGAEGAQADCTHPNIPQTDPDLLIVSKIAPIHPLQE